MKYRVTDETMAYEGATLRRIECVEGFGDVKAGERGGWLEGEGNLAQEGLCWVYGEAKVVGRAHVGGDVPVRGTVVIGGEVGISGDAKGPIIVNAAEIGGGARIGGDGISGDGYLR